jgi:hypothetical protein
MPNPSVLAGALARRYRGSLSYDGGVTNFLPSPPVDYTARVCSLLSESASLRPCRSAPCDYRRTADIPRHLEILEVPQVVSFVLLQLIFAIL